MTGKGPCSASVSLKVLGLEQYFTLIKPSSAESQQRGGHFGSSKGVGLTPGEAIYIGDAPTDVLAARKVGCCVASVCWASTAQANVFGTVASRYHCAYRKRVEGVAAAETGHLIVTIRKSTRDDKGARIRGARKHEGTTCCSSAPPRGSVSRSPSSTACSMLHNLHISIQRLSMPHCRTGMSILDCMP